MGSKTSFLTDILETQANDQFPWLDKKLRKLPDEQLKVVSASWPPEIWEKYLSWFETPMAETLISSSIYNRECEKQIKSVFSGAQPNAETYLRQKIQRYLDSLNPKQKQIIKMSYWHGRSERQIAEKLKISRTRVRQIKAQAISKISNQLNHSSISNYILAEI